MVPVESAVADPDIKFNKALSQGSIVAQNAFGVLNNRFPILRRSHLDLQRACLVGRACCIIHNIASDDRDEYIGPDDPENEIDVIGQRMASSESGLDRRVSLINLFE